MSAYFKAEAERLIDESAGGRPGRDQRLQRPVREVRPQGLPRRAGPAGGRSGAAAEVRRRGLQRLRPAQRAAGRQARQRHRGHGMGGIQHRPRTCQSEGGIGWQLYQMADEGKISEHTAQQILKSIFAAGFDTTTASIASMIRAFADNPGGMAEAAREPGPGGQRLGGSHPPLPGLTLRRTLGHQRNGTGRRPDPGRRQDPDHVARRGTRSAPVRAPDEFHVDRDIKHAATCPSALASTPAPATWWPGSRPEPCCAPWWSGSRRSN